MSKVSHPITFWHGAKRWDGPPTITPPRSGHYECGPGIYCTTHYMTARKYTKGGGTLMRMHLANDMNWLEHAEMPLAKMIDFLKSVPRLRRRDAIIADLRDSDARKRKHRRHGDSTDLPVSYLVNLGIFHEAFSGEPGVLLAKWLAENGIDGSMHNCTNGEQWIIVFNTDKILKHEVVRAKEADALKWPDFQSYQEQVLLNVLDTINTEDGNRVDDQNKVGKKKGP